MKLDSVASNVAISVTSTSGSEADMTGSKDSTDWEYKVENMESLLQNGFDLQADDAITKPKSAFYYGCSVPIRCESPYSEMVSAFLKTRQTSSPPVPIRFDDNCGETYGELTFLPRSYHRDAKDQMAVKRLDQTCSPGIFGQGSEIDSSESYRKAGTFTNDQFSINFNPYRLGTIAANVQTLRPSVTKPLGHVRCDRVDIVADIY
ncbi:MAG: hypothetical protein Q9166_007265 [cf. Caloplaca sp. 2 TL-2023]